jgi:hypothetical protein
VTLAFDVRSDAVESRWAPAFAGVTNQILREAPF